MEEEAIGLRGAGAMAPGGRGDATRSFVSRSGGASDETRLPLPVRGALIPVLCENRFEEGDCWSELGGVVNKIVWCDCGRGANTVMPSWYW